MAMYRLTNMKKRKTPRTSSDDLLTASSKAPIFASSLEGLRCGLIADVFDDLEARLLYFMVLRTRSFLRGMGGVIS